MPIVDDHPVAPGTLTLAGLPIGHRDDASPRLRGALENAGIIAAEDTRRVRGFANRLGLRLGGERGARIISYYDANERGRAEQLLEELRAGHDILLVTDAGMPGVSDPGYRLVNACVAAEVPVTVIPGPSAVIAALVLSGLPTDRFSFEGFPPRKGLVRWLAELATERRTMVFFESPHRLAATLSAMTDAFGPDRHAAACRELTKTHEEVRRATLAELTEWASGEVRGEVTLVVAGADQTPARPPTAEELAAAVADLETEGSSRKEAITAVARSVGIPKREVYDAVHRG